ncbi:MAG: hypothetical protein EOP83_09170 [Verrucomicrobiaceae bacterium]|nr:MAG: hypothetical protein EOP83_09170 [Verrucomicrobiaceae bacterium]
MTMIRTDLIWFDDEGWVAAFFVQPSKDFHWDLPVMQWFADRDIPLEELSCMAGTRREFHAVLSPDQAFEFKMAYGDATEVF